MSLESIREQLNITPIFVEKINYDESHDKVRWSPKWTCFCCEDKGIVKECLAEIAIDNYSKDDLIICLNTRCCKSNLSQSWLDGKFALEVLDSITCNKLHQYNRTMWEQWKSEDARKVRESVNAFLSL